MELEILPPKVLRTEAWSWDCPLCDFIGTWKKENRAITSIRKHMTVYHRITNTEVFPQGFIE